MKTLGLAAVVTIAGLMLCNPSNADPTGRCGYYTNSRGQHVPRPCGSWRSGEPKPAEATAKCADGTWSWSRHPRDPRTCSYHGGKVGALLGSGDPMSASPSRSEPRKPFKPSAGSPKEIPIFNNAREMPLR